MGGVFSSPKSPKIPAQQVAEEPQVIQEDETEVKRKKRKLLETQGRSENILAGLSNALKKKLGE